MSFYRLFPVLYLWATALTTGVEMAYADESGLEPVTIQLRWSHQFQFAGYYAAKEKGYYAEEGLDVSLRELDLKEGHITSLLEGKAQYGISDSRLLELRNSGQPVVLLAQIFQHSPAVLMTRRDSGILDAYSLRGKKIMMVPVDFGTASLRAMFLKTLGSLDSITIIPRTYDPLALKDDNLDAVSAYLSNEPFRSKRADMPVNIIDPRSYGIDFYGDNLFTTEMEIKSHPERVKKVIRATLKGWEYALKHKEEIIEFIRTKYAPDLDHEQLEYEARIIEQMIVPDHIPLGDIDPARYKNIAETYQRLGMTETGSLPPGFIYGSNETKLEFTAEEKAWLAKNLTIRTRSGILHPYQFVKDGKSVGIAMDFLNLISKNSGITFQIENKTSRFSEAMERLIAHEDLDLVPSIMPTSEREKVIRFTQPYFTSPQFFFTRDKTPFIYAMETISGKTIAVIKNYAVNKQLVKKFPDINPLVCKNYKEALEAVSTGKAFAMVGDLLATPFMMNEYGIKNLKGNVASGLPNHELAFGIRHDWPELQSILDKELAAIPSADKAAIINKWSSVKFDHGVSPEDVLTWVLIVVIAVSGIILLFILWNQSLKKQVRQRTDELTAEINERKQAEAALAESELKYRGLVDNSLIGVFTNDLSGQFSFVNAAMSKMYDYDSAEQMLAASTIPLWINLEDRDYMLSLLKKHGKVSNYEAETVTKTGRHIHVLFSATLHEGNLTGMVMDITDRKKLELTLKESEIHLQRAQEIAIVGSWEINLLTNTIFWSNEVYRIFDLSQDALISYERFLEFILPEDREFVDQSRQAALQGEPYDIEHRIRVGDKVKWLREKAYLEFAENGKPNRAVGIVQDITERKRAEGEVHKSESKYRVLLDNLPQKIFLKDTHSTYISCNENYARDLGIKPEEIAGKTDYDFFPRELADKYRGDDKRILQLGQTERLEEEYELDGKRTWVVIIKSIVQDEKGKVTGLLGTFLDITERKQAEEKLQQYQQKLKSLAVQLTLVEEQERRRIAEDLHDYVGQSLALARMQLEAARKGLPKNDKRDTQFDDMSQSLLKAIQDTRHLIFELSSPSLNELGLSAAISEWLDVQIADKHGLKIKLFDHAQDVSVDVNLRAILFRNVRELLTNAIKHAQARAISVCLESTADGLKVTVQDDGVGFDSGASMRNNDAEGGFGLFSIQERMTNLGGKLIIVSQPGAGCKAALVLPIQQQKPERKT